MDPNALVLIIGSPVALALVAVLGSYVRSRARRRREEAKETSDGHER
jgi:hypothetical protein